MGLNINGYTLVNSSGLKFGASNSKVDVGGRVLTPNLPAMFGAKSGVSWQNQAPWTVNSLITNINACWTGNNTFTCPVAGIYYTCWNGIVYGGQADVGTTANSGYGSVLLNDGLVFFFHWNTAARSQGAALPCLIPCQAGDTIRWNINTAPQPANPANTFGAYGDNHNLATIWLLG